MAKKDRVKRMVDQSLEEFETVFEIDLDEEVTEEEVEAVAKEIEKLKGDK